MKIELTKAQAQMVSVALDFAINEADFLYIPEQDKWVDKRQWNCLRRAEARINKALGN